MELSEAEAEACVRARLALFQLSDRYRHRTSAFVVFASELFLPSPYEYNTGRYDRYAVRMYQYTWTRE